MSKSEAVRRIKEHALNYQREMSRDEKLEEAMGMAVESLEADRIREKGERK